VDQYLDQTAPWTTLKQNRDEAALSVFTALRAIDSLKVLFSPFLPFTCQRLHGFLGYEGELFGESRIDTVEDSLGEHRVLRYVQPAGSVSWKPSQLEPGRRLLEPGPLFKKLDEAVIGQNAHAWASSEGHAATIQVIASSCSVTEELPCIE
jgi:methionyl-tRNA synthetase